ncbi:MAG: hypothetical protein ABEJ91_02145 [Candidatus Nanohaloarchaea archaeon]
MGKQEGAYAIFRSRIPDWQLLQRREKIGQEGVPVEVAYDGDFGYIVVPAGSYNQVRQYLEDMEEFDREADEATVATQLNLGEPGLARLRGEFDIDTYLSGREKKKPAD